MTGPKTFVERCGAAARVVLRASLVACFALASCSCGRTTDVAGYVLTADGTTQPESEPNVAPVIVENEVTMPSPEPAPDSGASAPTFEPPLVVTSTAPDASAAPTIFDRGPRPRPPDGGVPPQPLEPGLGLPMDGGEPDFSSGALWVSGWPIQGPPSPVLWPLEVPLFEFFGPGRPGLQVGVWVRDEQARVLMDWWLGIPPQAPEVFEIEGQRFVVTTDFVGDVFAVSAELPPDGTEVLFPIPEPPPPPP